MTKSPTAQDRRPISPQFVKLCEDHSAALQNGDLGLATAISREIMEFAAEQAQRLQSIDSPETREMELLATAEDAEAAGNWDAARQIYQRCLDEAVENEGLQAMSHLRLAKLHCREGNLTTAYNSARDALIAAKQFDVNSLIAMAAWTIAPIASRLGRQDEATAYIDEALVCLGSDRMFDIFRGKLLIERADIGLAAQDTACAAVDLDAAKCAFAGYWEQPASPGIERMKGRWWQVEAKRQFTAGSWDNAHQAWSESIESMRWALAQLVVTGWQSEAMIKLFGDEIGAVVAEYATAADHAGDVELATKLRSKLNN
jgi:hypothetical protein